MTIKNRNKREQLEELVKTFSREVRELIGEEVRTTVNIHNISPMLFERRDDEMVNRLKKETGDIIGYLTNTDNPNLWLFSKEWTQATAKQIDGELE
jgi:hypothetical protein